MKVRDLMLHRMYGHEEVGLCLLVHGDCVHLKARKLRGGMTQWWSSDINPIHWIASEVQ